MPTQSRNDRLIQAFALTLLVGAIALRIVYLQEKPLWLDESWSHWFSGQTWGSLIAGVISYDTHPPFYYSALKLWRSLFDESALALRSLSLIASIATLVIVGRTARSMPRAGMNRNAWLAALALAAVSPPIVEAARQARPYALLILAFAAALRFAFRIIQQWQDDNDDKGDWRLWLGYVLSLEGVLWLHTLGALQAFALFSSLALALRSCGATRQRVLTFLAAHCVAGTLWLPSFAVLLQQQENWTQGTWLVFQLEGAGTEYLQAVAAPGMFGIGLVLLAFCGLMASFRHRNMRIFGISLFVCAVVPALLEIILSMTVSPVFLGRTLAPAAVPIVLLASLPIGLSSRKLVPAAATACVAAGLLISSWQLISRAPEERWGELGTALAKRLGPSDEVWLLPNELVLPLQLASPELSKRTRIEPLPFGFPAKFQDGPHPSGTAAVVALTPESARKLVQGARRRGVESVWVVSRFAWLFDPNSELAKAFGAPAIVEKEDRFAPLFVQRYRVNAPDAQGAEGATR